MEGRSVRGEQRVEGRDEHTEAENVNANYISILLSRDRLTKTPTKLQHILNYRVLLVLTAASGLQ